MKYIYGIDIGGTTIKMGLFAEDGTLKEKWEIKTRTEDNGKNIISDIATAVNDHMKENDLTREDVIGIGAGVPGAVLEFARVNECVNLGWGVLMWQVSCQNLQDALSKQQMMQTQQH